MASFSVTSAVPNIRADASSVAPKKPQVNDASFDNLVAGIIDKVNGPSVEANQQLKALATGETDNVHSAVLSMVQADMSFRLALEVRNRLTEAYQEVMRMQI